MISPLVSKLERREELSDAERLALANVLDKARPVAAGETIIGEGSRPEHSTFLVSGFVGRVSFVADGGRQITELNVPGDFIDLHSFLIKEMDHSLVALTDALVAPAPHSALKTITEELPHLTRLLWLETVIDAAVHRQWLVAMGRKEAAPRLAQLFCEIYLRLEAAGLAADNAFDLPLTQSDVADILGITTVHVNRSLMSLRDQNLVEWRRGQVLILDWTGLSGLADFDPTYLRLKKVPV